MKNTGRCTKCGSGDIAVNRASGKGPVNTIVPGLTYLSAIPCDKFICLNCGYIEQWVHDRSGIDKISKTCERYRVSK